MKEYAAGDWFEQLFGFTETDRRTVHSMLEVDGATFRSRQNELQWTCGKLEVISLAELRCRRDEIIGSKPSQIRVSELIGNVKLFHADPANAGALFQVASQFNLLEMVGPDVTPEEGITRYEFDGTQGPACAMACAAGTVYRNYFVPLDGQLGQTADQQVDGLAGIGAALGNANGQLWRMRNGYALPSASGLKAVDSKLKSMTEAELDDLRSKLQIGVQWDTQVTLAGCQHLVTQAYCSAMPVSYSGLPRRDWERFAKLVLEAAYEATFAAAAINAEKSGNRGVFLTLLGGGAFGNEESWILEAIERAVHLYHNVDLDMKIVSYSRSNPAVQRLCESFAK
jgi:hypothetical protein